MPLEIVAADSPFVTALVSSFADIRREKDELHAKAQNSVELDRAHLARVCNVAFWASLCEEERRSIRVNLAMGSPAEFRNPLIFTEAEPFEVKSLVSLASAAVGSVLGVHIGTDNSLQIWGIAKRPPKLALIVSIIKPGTIGVFFYRGLLPVVSGLIDDGELVIPSDASLGAFQQLVADTFKGNAPDLGSRFRRAGQLIEIVHAMCAHGHGGTLVIVPDDSSWQKHVTLRYSCGVIDGSDFLKTYSEASLVSAREAVRAGSHSSIHPSPQHLTQKARKERALTRQALRRVGQLTAVDGAVVIGNNFMVYGFGASLKPPENNSEVIRLDALTGENTVIPLAQLGGTRHQSAARFVYANDQSIAIISSQDGGLTLIGRTKNQAAIIAIQNLQHLLINWHGPIE